MANPSDFFAQMMPYAQRVSQQTGLDPRLVLAQAALETGYGRSAPGNNFFGIKSHNRSGGNTLQTQEFEGGRMVTKPQSFRGYETPAQSFEDYGRFLQENPRYKPVLAAGTLEEQIAAMARSGYATDPNYGQKLASIASRVDPNAPVNIASDAMRAIGRPSGGGLLAPNETVSTQGRTAGQGEPMTEERGLLGGLLNPDRRDRLIMALEGMTLNPNQALIQASGEAIKGRAESQQSKQAANRTAAWLRSQGREDLAAAVESGAVSGKDAASAALQPAEARGQLVTAEQLRAQFPGTNIEDGLYNLKPDGTANKVGGGGTTVKVSTGEGAPGLGKLGTDYGYVMDPATGQPVIDPNTGLPRAAPIPGSETARRLEAEAQAAQQQQAAGQRQQGTKDSVISRDVDALISMIDDTGMFNLPEAGILGNLLGATGINQEAVTFKNTLSSIQASVAFDTLQKMREASKTGGALGAVSERELDLLINSLGALQQNTDPATLKRNLLDVKRVMTKIENDPVASRIYYGGSTQGAAPASSGGFSVTGRID